MPKLMMKVVIKKQNGTNCYLEMAIPPEVMYKIREDKISGVEFLFYGEADGGLVTPPQIQGVADLNEFKTFEHGG